MEKKKGVGWAVMLDREAYLIFVDRELADRRATQVGGTVEEMFIFAEQQEGVKKVNTCGCGCHLPFPDSRCSCDCAAREAHHGLTGE